MEEFLEIEVKYVYETDLSVLIEYEGLEYWLPKSQIDYDNKEYEQREELEIKVPVWLLEEKGMI